MNPTRHDEASRWLAQAQEDLGAARDLLASGHFALACFHAQQAAEKALKGFLHAQGADDPWGHAVSRLLADVREGRETIA